MGEVGLFYEVLFLFSKSDSTPKNQKGEDEMITKKVENGCLTYCLGRNGGVTIRDSQFKNIVMCPQIIKITGEVNNNFRILNYLLTISKGPIICSTSLTKEWGSKLKELGFCVIDSRLVFDPFDMIDKEGKLDEQSSFNHITI